MDRSHLVDLMDLHEKLEILFANPLKTEKVRNPCANTQPISKGGDRHNLSGYLPLSPFKADSRVIRSSSLRASSKLLAPSRLSSTSVPIYSRSYAPYYSFQRQDDDEEKEELSLEDNTPLLKCSSKTSIGQHTRQKIISEVLLRNWSSTVVTSNRTAAVQVALDKSKAATAKALRHAHFLNTTLNSYQKDSCRWHSTKKFDSIKSNIESATVKADDDDEGDLSCVVKWFFRQPPITKYSRRS
ncbi:uncharacterized protein RSE6_10500 [Rhynchosporium secalis]|uniref:Uncharacterized protein n=1 Tax=Rhynchosporium secalis TaxID=38038 RepID=A0A1E1MKJ9_RHYSE|nr:uncharacterized protein RSE6_10500 [Rhynchosporium secalis]